MTNGVANGGTSADAPARQELTYLAPKRIKPRLQAGGSRFESLGSTSTIPSQQRAAAALRTESPLVTAEMLGVALGWVDGSEMGMWAASMTPWSDGMKVIPNCVGSALVGV